MPLCILGAAGQEVTDDKLIQNCVMTLEEIKEGAVNKKPSISSLLNAICHVSAHTV